MIEIPPIDVEKIAQQLAERASYVLEELRRIEEMKKVPRSLLQMHVGPGRAKHSAYPHGRGEGHILMIPARVMVDRWRDWRIALPGRFDSSNTSRRSAFIC